jgi:hypothetical protein
MNNKIGYVLAVIALIAAGVSASLYSKAKTVQTDLTANIADLEAELEAAKITARNAAKSKVVEQIVAVADTNTDEVARLKAQLAAQQDQLAQLRTAPTSTEDAEAPAEKKAPTPFPEERTPESMKSFFDRMKEEDPERFKRMQEGMASMQERVTNTLGDRIDFFATLDVSGMNAQDMELLAVTVEKMNAMNQLMSGLDTNSQEIDAFEARSQMFTQMKELGDLMRETRGVLEADMIRGLGYNETETQELSEYLGSIQEMTSMRSMFRGPGGGRGFGGGPGGGGPPADTEEK